MLDFAKLSSYKNGMVSGQMEMQSDITTDIEGRDVIIVEDIIDSGNTLAFILKYFEAKGASSVKICTLLSKPDRRVVEIPVDYIGAEIPDEFVIGYGLDYAEKYRNLPYVGILKRSVYS
jgi:hypoxanthine phosphoribosyltransferase